MNRKGRKERIEDIRKMARESYKDHVITEQFGVRMKGLWGQHWVVRNTSSIIHLGEIVVLYGPRLIVHGDIPDVLFGHFGGTYDEIVEWVAESQLDYLADKVLTEGHEFDADMAEHDLKEMLEEVKNGEYDESWKGQIEQVLDLFQYDQTEQGLYAATDGLAGYEEFNGVGRVVNSDIIWAQEMVRKLQELRGHGTAERAT